MKNQGKMVILLFYFLIHIQLVMAQQSVSIMSDGESLNQVLSEITEKYSIKFAFDSDSFEKVKTRFNIKNATLDEFLERLESEYFIKSKFIDGTWVLIATEPKIFLVPEPEAEPPKPKFIAVSGFVKDKNSGEELIYCNVAAGENRGGMTNELGYFNIMIPADDSVAINISHLGYHRLDTIVPANQTAKIYLIPSEIVMEAIQVTRFEKQVLQASPQPGKFAFNPVKSSNAPRISNDDLANALLLIPGVSFVQGSSSGLSVRGGSPTDNLVLFDGIPVLETSHLLGNMSVLNSKFVQQAFVSRGGFDAEFGGRVSGLIQLTGKSGKNNRPYLDLSANLLNTNVLANVPITSKFSVTAAWRRSFIDRWQNYLYMRLIDDVSPGDQQENTVTSTINPMVRYEDVNTKISFHPSDKLELNLNFLYGNDHQSRDFTLLQTKDYYRNESVNSENMGFSVNWNWQAGRNWFHSFSAGYSNLEKKMVDETGELEEVTEVVERPGKGKGKGKGLLKTKEKTYERFVYDIDNGFNRVEEYRLTWKTALNTGIFKSQFGAGWNSDDYAYHFIADRPDAPVEFDSIVNSATQYMANGFVQQNIAVHPAFNFRWGVRADVDLVSGKIYWQPRGGIEIKPFEGFGIHFSGGVYNQFLSGVKRIDSEGHFNQVWYLADKNGVGAVKSVHSVLGAKFEKNGWFVDVEGYRKNAENKMSFFAETVQTGSEQVVAYFLRQSNERSKGIDFFLQKKHYIFNHMVGYSVAKTEEQIEKVLNNSWFPGYNDRTHRLKLTEMVNWKNWSLTGSWQYATGLPVIHVTELNAYEHPERSDYYSQLDFALVKTYHKKFFAAEAGVSLLNVLNRRNIVEVDYLRFSSDQESLTIRSDISSLAFTPVFFVNFKFR